MRQEKKRAVDAARAALVAAVVADARQAVNIERALQAIAEMKRGAGIETSAEKPVAFEGCSQRPHGLA
jgi:hypothetical protein